MEVALASQALLAAVRFPRPPAFSTTDSAPAPSADSGARRTPAGAPALRTALRWPRAFLCGPALGLGTSGAEPERVKGGGRREGASRHSLPAPVSSQPALAGSPGSPRCLGFLWGETEMECARLGRGGARGPWLPRPPQGQSQAAGAGSGRSWTGTEPGVWGWSAECSSARDFSLVRSLARLLPPSPPCPTRQLGAGGARVFCVFVFPGAPRAGLSEFQVGPWGWGWGGRGRRCQGA